MCKSLHPDKISVSANVYIYFQLTLHTLQNGYQLTCDIFVFNGTSIKCDIEFIRMQQMILKVAVLLMLMGSYKRAVTSLLMHWSYVFLALTHRCEISISFVNWMMCAEQKVLDYLLVVKLYSIDMIWCVSGYSSHDITTIWYNICYFWISIFSNSNMRKIE